MESAEWSAMTSSADGEKAFKADQIYSQIKNDISFKRNQYVLRVLSAHTFRNYRYFILKRSQISRCFSL